MDPLGAAQAVALVRPPVAVPIHWGTFFPVGLEALRGSALVEPPRIFARHVAELAPEVEVRVLAPGDELAARVGSRRERGADGARRRAGFRYGGVLLLTLAVAIFALIAPDGSAVRTIELFAAGATLLVAVLTSRAPAATRRVGGRGCRGRRARRRHRRGALAARILP